MIKGFKEFLLKNNVLALAIAVLQNDIAWLRREVAKHSQRLQ